MSRNLSDAVAARIRAIRKRRGLSNAGLAEDCAKLGAPHLTGNVLTNIETGRPLAGVRRREITIDELDVIQRALGVCLMDITLTCQACNGSPPAGFSCLACGASLAQEPTP